MNEMLSRNGRLCEKLIEVATHRNWSYKTKLYPSEIKRVQKQWGVKVDAEIPKGMMKGLIPCEIKWDNAFTAEGLNYKQSWYISKLTDDFPAVENFAQQLYIITARARA